MGADVIVAGVGAAGAATAWRLAARGRRVLGFDRFDIPNTRGSSHGQTRMTRTAYYEHPDYVPLLLRAHALWHELEALRPTDPPVLHMTGGVYFGDPTAPLLIGSTAAARLHRLAHEVLAPAERRARYPQFDLPTGHGALLETLAGYLRVEPAVTALADAARAAGAELRANDPVISWTTDATGVTACTAGGTYRASAIVLAAGPWNPRLLTGDSSARPPGAGGAAAVAIEHPAGRGLTVTRQTLGWWRTAGDLPATVWAIDRGDGTLVYGFPVIDGLAKAAVHAPGPAVSPDDPAARIVTAADHDALREAVAAIPALARGTLVDVRVCYYTVAPDGHFRVGVLPGTHGRAVLVSGCSGHGFKFAPVLGEAAADLATEGRSSLPIDFLRPPM